MKTVIAVFRYYHSKTSLLKKQFWLRKLEWRIDRNFQQYTYFLSKTELLFKILKYRPFRQQLTSFQCLPVNRSRMKNKQVRVDFIIIIMSHAIHLEECTNATNSDRSYNSWFLLILQCLERVNI